MPALPFYFYGCRLALLHKSLNLPTHSQHRTAPFQKDRTALDWHGARGGRDDFKLMIAERNHAAH
jgi:hypothetical protein